jgi:hypothetical protein
MRPVFLLCVSKASRLTLFSWDVRWDVPSEASPDGLPTVSKASRLTLGFSTPGTAPEMAQPFGLSQAGRQL